MLGFGATGQFAIGQASAGGTAETVTMDKWFQALSEPVRFRLGLQAAEQQFFIPSPFPVVSFSWFQELSKPPVLTLPGLRPSQQQFFALDPLPRVSFSWFEGLSEPARFKPGLAAALQQFYAADTTVIPTTKLMEWFAPLSEPVRFKPGLLAALQQFLAHPPQLRPTPNISGVLAAVETKDVFLAGGTVFNRVISGEIGVTEQKFTGAQIGISVPVIAGSRVAITIL